MPMTHCRITAQDVDVVLDEKENEEYVSKVVLMAGETLHPRYTGYRANSEKNKELEVILERNYSILRREL